MEFCLSRIKCVSIVPTDIVVFIYTQRFFKKLTFSGGLRYDNRSIDSKSYFEGVDLRFPAFKKSFSNFSGSAGISYEANERLTLKVNLARGFRSPSLAELASNGAHEGTNRYEYGNPGLKSETSLQGDLGFEFNYEHFHFNLSAFYNRVNDFIFYRKLLSVNGGDSLVTVDNEDIPAFRFDQSHAKLYGIEASLDIHPHPLDWLHFENTFSWVRGKFDDAIDGSENIPMIPAARWISDLRANISKAGKSLRNLYIKVEADNTLRQDKAFTGYGTETATPAYTLFNAGFGTDVSNKKRTLFSVHLFLGNIFDKAYQNHLSRLKYSAVNNATGRNGVFNSGRNFSIKLNVPLEGKF